MKKGLIFLFIFALGLSSCRSGVYSTLEDVESYIQERPDSAFVVLESIDRSSLLSGRTKAKFALLYAMALDKNYIDTTDISIIAPAVEYYSRHGNPDDKLKALYYEGNIYVNGHDDNQAAISFSRAEAVVPDATDDKYIGMLYISQSMLFGRVHNSLKREAYIEKALASLAKTSERSNYDKALPLLASARQCRYRLLEADSIYRLCLEIWENDSIRMPDILTNYASLKMLYSQKDPGGARDLLDKKWKIYHAPLNIKDYGLYAYASSMLGDKDLSDRIYEQILSKSSDNRAPYLRYLCDMESGDLASAIDNLNKTYSHQDAYVDSLLSNSIEESLSQYFKLSFYDERHRSRARVWLTALIGLVAISALAIISLVFKRKQERTLKKVESLLSVADDANRMSEHSADVSVSRNRNLCDLRVDYLSVYKEKYRTIKQLCESFLLSQGKDNQKEIIYRKVMNLLSFISEDERQYQKFEDGLNKELNGIIAHLKEDLSPIEGKDVKLVCFSIVGLYPQMIASILDWSLSNVYTRKSRLKERIRNLDSPYKEDYLRLF